MSCDQRPTLALTGCATGRTPGCSPGLPSMLVIELAKGIIMAQFGWRRRRSAGVRHLAYALRACRRDAPEQLESLTVRFLGPGGDTVLYCYVHDLYDGQQMRPEKLGAWRALPQSRRVEGRSGAPSLPRLPDPSCPPARRSGRAVAPARRRDNLTGIR
jgi:hypothetical protein